MYTYVRTTTTTNTWSGLIYQLFVWTSGASNRSLCDGVLASSSHCSYNSVCSLASVVCLMAPNMAQIQHISVIQGPLTQPRNGMSRTRYGFCFQRMFFCPRCLPAMVVICMQQQEESVWGLPQLPALWIPTALFMGGGVKDLGCEDDHSRPFSVKFSMRGTVSTPHLPSWQGKLPFLGIPAKLWKVTICSTMSICQHAT
jgi:hypothetical protein